MNHDKIEKYTSDKIEKKYIFAMKNRQTDFIF